jgi:ketosteroid isomerase-like protein
VQNTTAPLDRALQMNMSYLGALERYDLDAALACFSPDVEYHHHPFSQVHEGLKEDTEWHLVRGYDELRALFEFRGPDPILHRITGFARSGNLCFAEGYVPGDEGPQPKVTWISIWTVDDQDRMLKYHQYIQWPSVTVVGSDDLSCAGVGVA